MFLQGEMMYVSALGKGVLVTNSQRVAVDLLEKRSNIYSDRQSFISAGEFATRKLFLAMTPYGDLYVVDSLTFTYADLIFQRWRRFRRVVVEGFSKSVVHRFYPIQGREALMLALALIKSPPDPEKHFYRHALSIMLSVNYHFPPVESEDDPAVVATANHLERMIYEMQPGSRLVEFFNEIYSEQVCTHPRHGLPVFIVLRFAKWKRNAKYWFIKDSLMFEGFLGKVADDLVSYRSDAPMRCVILVSDTRGTESIVRVSVPQ